MSTKYNEYLSEHLANVRKAYFWLKDHAIIDLKEFESYFLKQLNIHDLSKYSQEEYYAYDNYFYGAETEKVKRTLIMLGFIIFTKIHIIGSIGC